MRWLFGKGKGLADATALYEAIVAEARRPAWYREAGIPDTMDGRFDVLTNVLAIADRRLGQGGETARAIAPRLTEIFVADMDAQMREAGFGDPSIGKQVKQMVGALAARTSRWSKIGSDQSDWAAAADQSLYDGNNADETQQARGTELLQDWYARLGRTDDEALAQGEIG